MTLAVADHKAASEAMAALKEQLLDGVVLEESAKMCLTCAGIAVGRRLATEMELPDAMIQLRSTIALLFVLVVISSGIPPVPSGAGPSDMDVGEGEEEQGAPNETLEDDDPRALLHWYNTHCVADSLYETLIVSTSSCSWTEVLRTDAGALCRAALAEAMAKGGSMDLEALGTLGKIFFRASANAMATALFNSCAAPGDDFLTLGTASYLAKANDNKSDKLAAISSVAESEAGQTVLRDIILSFTLPRDVVGVRRTCLLTREANAQATANYTEILNSAHEAAMRGAEWCWAEDTNEVHKMSSLIAGVAVLLARGQQSIRKDDAFEGRFDLPFLETRPPKEGLARMALMEATAEWIVYSVSPQTGKPIVQLRAAGFEGLCQATLAFVGHLKL